MKTLLAQLALLLAFSVTTGRSQNRFSVSVSAAPVYSYNRSTATFIIPDATGQQVRSRLDFRSSIGGFSAGLSARYAFTPAWSVSTGLWLNQLLYTQPFPFAPNNVSSRVTASGYQIPLLVNYRPATRRLSPYFSAGGLAYLYRNTRYKPADGSGLSPVSVTFGGPVTIQAVVGIGASYELTPRWSLTAQPLFIWRFPPGKDSFVSYTSYVSYQLQGLVELGYAF